MTRYAAKRDFTKTPEPRGNAAKSTGNSYVIQKHAATRLHYDFRLELDGVLKSWAVTKGPSLDPAVRRLAVHVEDHPLAYGSFEGVIPHGQYGGGTVMVWDRGTWEPVGDARAGCAAGRLKFVLKGKRLKGSWLLVRMRGRAAQEGRDNWLLIKDNDRQARPGHGDVLLAQARKSVISGKTMEQIAGARDAKVWQSKASAKAKARPVPSLRAAGRGATHAKQAPNPSHTVGARRGALPSFVAPQLATLSNMPPKTGDWLHEIKIDGYRAYCRRRHGEVRFLTRTGQDWTDRFEALDPAVAALPGGDFALDGEIAVFDDRGISSFAALQAALSAKHGNRLVYIVFDLLYLDGYDLRGAALRNRKSLLETLLAGAPKGGPLRYSEHLQSPGADVFAHACDLALEGIVSKRANRPYVSGRTADWLKAKCVTRQEFVICGYTPPKKSGRVGFASLILGYYEEEDLRYAGHVGTGFTQQILNDLSSRLAKLRIGKPAIAGSLPPLARRNAIWVRPGLVCEVAFTGWTRDGVLRQPSFQGLREDKPASSVHRERAAGPRRRAAATAGPPPQVSAKPARRSSNSQHVVAGVAISHPDREIFPGMGITKEGLAEYYRAVADWILPEIVDRPLSLLRCPTGVSGQCFFQKHFTTGMKSVDRIAIREKSGTADYLVVRDAHDLVALIQEGIIEIHPWGARADDPDKPDRMIFDLDPAPNVAFERVIEAAVAMRDLLAEFDLETFAKTTGGKGLHVVVPLRRGIGWKKLKDFTRAIAETFARADPARFTTTSAKQSRSGKIFIDYLRNDRGSTAVAGYCARARAGAPVAMPLAWSEVRRGLDPRKYSVTTVPRLLAKRRDPWRALYRSRQIIPAHALKTLGID